MSTRTRVPNIISKDYLINGKIQTWKGPQAQVYSHIVLDDEDQPTLIGEVPDMDGDIALKALDAAVNAYG
ncbi:MAG: NADP-dependent glyceraldehyde-3-phosphate dehydrogenase, partial [Psychroserpens sp.]|nr:NADP-dependent glyceraldehyde-3-phosphate dehydrogenase [Psychroserpens sp.]